MEKELIRFENTTEAVPYIKVKHNNIYFNLMIDTGCTASCIDNSILDLLLYKDTNEVTEGIIYANGETSDNIKIVELPISLGNLDCTEQFNAIDFKEASQLIKDTFGITIRGLLGSNFLYRHNLILDFNKNLIKYTNGNQTKINFEEKGSSKEID